MRLGSRLWKLECKVQGLGLSEWNLECRVKVECGNSGFRIQGLVFNHLFQASGSELFACTSANELGDECTLGGTPLTRGGGRLEDHG